MPSEPLASLGLGGDGDEVWVIEEVESVFGVKLDIRAAPQWRTVGDVFKSLQNALPPDRRDGPDVWTQFTQAMSSETGVDYRLVRPETVLLGPPFIDEVKARLKDWMRKLRGA